MGTSRDLPFGPDTVTWEVNLEPVVFVGSARALLLQVAHPLVAAGVEQHSDYAEDPWGRLYRTLEIMLTLAFGTPAASAYQSVRLAKRHKHVKGKAEDGRRYDALDPELMTWVWATLVDTSLLCFERGVRRLSPTERERYYQEQKLVAQGTGIPEGVVPETWDDFAAYVDRVIEEELEVTGECRSVAEATFEVPDPPIVGSILGASNRMTAAALLPEKVRDQLGLRRDHDVARTVDRIFRTYRAATRVTPAALRHAPIRAFVAWTSRQYEEQGRRVLQQRAA